MAVTPFDSAMARGLFGDAEIGALFTDSAEVRAMLLFEGALARVQGRLGLIPEEAAAFISRASETVVIDPAGLSAGMAATGVPVPALIEAFCKAAEAPEFSAYIHYGATSQDAVDTGLVLRLRRALDIMDGRLAALIEALTKRAASEAETVMAARTRSQIATPTTFGARIAVWCAGLERGRERLSDLRPRALRLSLGGASGTLSAMGPRGPEVAAALAEELRLHHHPAPWHASRDGLAELGAALTLITGVLGKIGADLLVMGRGEVGEVTLSAGGGSSTMPHKANPVAAEALVTLARANAGIVGRLFEAQIAAEERDGTAWALEWLTLPQIVIGAGAALGHAATAVAGMTAQPEAMQGTLVSTGGLMMAEAAVFALAAHLPRPEAQALVKEACRRAKTEGRDLRAMLEEATALPIDWQAVFDPRQQIGAAREIAKGNDG